MKIPFNKTFFTGNEKKYINNVLEGGHVSGDGSFTIKCQSWLEHCIRCNKALITHSCTAALEMAAILSDIEPGDEIIMPSYTFVSTANAFVLRGGVPVFIDIRQDTLNIDERKIESAITEKTRAIVPVHYAGVACEMDIIMAIAEKYDLIVIEDAAQGIMSSYKGRPLGSIGHLAVVSFHETKNIIAGEGGALLINDPQYVERAETIREKGTNRSRFFRGQVDKYTWVDIGSSYLPSELTAAFLWAQLEEAKAITEKRSKLWRMYYEAFADLEDKEKIKRPVVPRECCHNGHIFYLLLTDLERRTDFIVSMKRKGIGTTFHYIPLHSSPAGVRYSRTVGNMDNTNAVSECIVRLPLWVGLEEDINIIIDSVIEEVTW